MTQLSKPKIFFFFEKISISLKNRTKLKKSLESIFRAENIKLSKLSYVFCGDSRILELNRQFLKHDYYTDILTFVLSDKRMPVEGEIYISVDRVRDNSIQFGEPFYKELHRVIIHGALHLCGYKDNRKDEIKEMTKKEEEYLIKYFRVPRDTVSG